MLDVRVARQSWWRRLEHLSNFAKFETSGRQHALARLALWRAGAARKGIEISEEQLAEQEAAIIAHFDAADFAVPPIMEIYLGRQTMDG